MDNRKKIEQPVLVEFERFNNDFADSLRSETRLLKSAIDFLLSSNGKHVRPLLVLLVAKACGNVSDNAINSAVLLELLHTATLIHDDVVDDTKQRRGNPSLNAIYDNRIAVLVGDYILSTSLVRSTLTGDIRIIRIISQLGRDLSEGELEQLETAQESILDKSSYLHVIRKKTATLLSACTEIGAISANASDELINVSKEFGVYLGYCFQIKDDIFDYFRDTDIGKPTGNDIREGKITLPLLHALEVGEKEDVDKYLTIINNKDFTEENIVELIDFAISNGGIEYAEKEMANYHQKAVEVLALFPESEAKESLRMLADYIVSRDK